MASKTCDSKECGGVSSSEAHACAKRSIKSVYEYNRLMSSLSFLEGLMGNCLPVHAEPSLEGRTSTYKLYDCHNCSKARKHALVAARYCTCLLFFVDLNTPHTEYYP